MFVDLPQHAAIAVVGRANRCVTAVASSKVLKCLRWRTALCSRDLRQSLGPGTAPLHGLHSDKALLGCNGLTLHPAKATSSYSRLSPPGHVV